MDIETKIIYFSETGRVNTDAVIFLAKERADELVHPDIHMLSALLYKI